MQLGNTLIDKAADLCGGYAALARRIGTSKAALSEMKHGKRHISPEDAALIADAAHEDAHAAVIDAVIMRNTTGPKAERIRAVLGKARHGGAAAPWLLSLTAALTCAMAYVADNLTLMHIVCSRASRPRLGV